MTKDEILAQAAKAEQAADREIERLEKLCREHYADVQARDQRITDLKRMIAEQKEEIAHLRGYLTAIYDQRETEMEPPEQPRGPRAPVCRPLWGANNGYDHSFDHYGEVNRITGTEQSRRKEWYE